MVAKEVALVMPKMSMTMTEGVFVAWHKAAGDRIRQGDVVCEVTTDKVDMEVEATVDGVLARLVARPEDVIAVGEPIAYVESEADDLLEGLFDAPEASGPVPEEPRAPEPQPVRAAEKRGVAAVPAARRLAAERGVDLAALTPTGPWGTIRVADLPAGRLAKPAPARGRAAVARRMTPSALVPQFVLYRDVDLAGAERARNGASWTAVFVHVLAAALRAHPAFNASWSGDTLVRHEGVAVALAVDTPRGLLAPVLTDPDLCGLDELGSRVADVVSRAKAGKLGLAELSAPATTTVSNLGGLGVGAFQALLTPPQASALAMGAVERKVVPVPDGVGVRLRCSLGLTVDHRVADGADGARLLSTVQELLDGGLV
ncbi:hypothetical protein BAY61_07555 [Prauserella marina]|uniref:dihydrolipoamide acetyltransferase family protein n=1 Tax=Prauserella marina TaxID=530584 RepID=UPI000B839253|nr:dihydrolipoamide acetyltransferase family protein [Prauserella marina]ASR34857.1 hypothetical protein BAY61_07555 [Prauserella marina]